MGVRAQMLGFGREVEGHRPAIDTRVASLAQALDGGDYSASAMSANLSAKTDPGLIAVIEHRVFLRECLERAMEEKFPCAVKMFSSVEEFEGDLRSPAARLIILSCSGKDEIERDRSRSSLEQLRALTPLAPIVALATHEDGALMRLAFEAGAKGFIPMSMGFDLAIEAFRFVLAGGTYVPVEVLVSAPPPLAPSASGDRLGLTAREVLVLRAIRQGKPNKIIAYELNMCESTVKVHVRHIMKKLDAKNRTAAAMRAGELVR